MAFDQNIFDRMLSAVMREVDVEYTKEQVLNVFLYYFNMYQAVMGEEHPFIRKQQIKHIVQLMPYIERTMTETVMYGDVEPRQYFDLIDAYFNTEFSYPVDRNINHFFSGQIRELLYYQCFGSFC